jgi:hypothetical protein
MTTLSSELNALELDQIVGSALAAVIKAQGLAASQLASFIESVGFEPAATGQAPKARSFSFSFTRSELDKTTGALVQRQVTAEVPVLSILPVPAIAIDEATLDFELKIVAHEPGSAAVATAPAATGTKAGKVAAPLMAKTMTAAKLYAVPARAQIVRGTGGSASFDTTGSIKIHVVARRQDPLGLQKVQALLDAGATETVT